MIMFSSLRWLLVFWLFPLGLARRTLEQGSRPGLRAVLSSARWWVVQSGLLSAGSPGQPQAGFLVPRRRDGSARMWQRNGAPRSRLLNRWQWVSPCHLAHALPRSRPASVSAIPTAIRL
jgi:hypothetical protein